MSDVMKPEVIDEFDTEQTEENARKILKNEELSFYLGRLGLDTHTVEVNEIEDKPGTVIMRFVLKGKKSKKPKLAGKKWER